MPNPQTPLEKVVDEQRRQLGDIARLTRQLHDSPMSLLHHLTGWAETFLRQNPDLTTPWGSKSPINEASAGTSHPTDEGKPERCRCDLCKDIPFQDNSK